MVSFKRKSSAFKCQFTSNLKINRIAVILNVKFNISHNIQYNLYNHNTSVRQIHLIIPKN